MWSLFFFVLDSNQLFRTIVMLFYAILQSWLFLNCRVDACDGEHTVQQNIESFLVDCTFAGFQIFCVYTSTLTLET